MKRKILIAAGLVLVIFTAFWQFALAPHFTQRITPGWTWETKFVGIQTYADPQTGQMPERDDTSIYNYFINTVPNSEQSGSVELYNRYVLHDIVSGKVVFEYDFSAPVNPQTGAHLKEEYQGDYFVFPRNVERKTYNIRFSYLKGLPLAFKRVEELHGLSTYLFTYHGRAEYTESYAGTDEFPGYKVEPGQEIRCGDDQFLFRVWVEPLTGEIVKIKEGCPAGSRVYHIASGKQLFQIDRWGGVSAGDDVVHRVEAANRERTKLLWITRYIPLSLLLTGLLCFGWAFLPGRLSEKKDV